MKGYLIFDQEKLPDPDTYDIKMDNVENENQTEAGTKQIIMVRSGVHSIGVSFKVTSKWLKKLTAYRGKDEILVGFYNPAENAMTEKVMRIKDYSVTLNKESENLTWSNGIWEVSFSLEEF